MRYGNVNLITQNVSSTDLDNSRSHVPSTKFIMHLNVYELFLFLRMSSMSACGGSLMQITFRDIVDMLLGCEKLLIRVRRGGIHFFFAFKKELKSGWFGDVLHINLINKTG